MVSRLMAAGCLSSLSLPRGRCSTVPGIKLLLAAVADLQLRRCAARSFSIFRSALYFACALLHAATACCTTLTPTTSS